MGPAIYWNLVEETAQQVDPLDVIVPADTLALIDELGYSTDAFQDDVLDHAEARLTTTDERQSTLPFEG